MYQPGLLHRVLWLGLMLMGCSMVLLKHHQPCSYAMGGLALLI